MANGGSGMIIKPVKLLIATIGLGLGSAAIAENLVYYGEVRPGSIFLYDSETIRKIGDTVTVWTKRDASKDRSVRFRTAMQKIRIDCSDETLGSLSYTEYGADGSIMVSESTSYPEMSPIIPGSVGYSLFQEVCAN
jgi:hypothetical protein